MFGFSGIFAGPGSKFTSNRKTKYNTVRIKGKRKKG